MLITSMAVQSECNQLKDVPGQQQQPTSESALSRTRNTKRRRSEMAINDKNCCNRSGESELSEETLER